MTLSIVRGTYGGADVTATCQTMFSTGISIAANGYVNIFGDPYVGQYKDFMSVVVDSTLTPPTTRLLITDNDTAHSQLPGSLHDSDRADIVDVMPNQISGYYDLWTSEYINADVYTTTNGKFEGVDQALIIAVDGMLGLFGTDPLPNVVKSLQMFGYLVKNNLVWHCGFWTYEPEYTYIVNN